MAYHHKSGAQKRKEREEKLEKSQKNQLTLENFCTKKSKKNTDIEDEKPKSVSCGKHSYETFYLDTYSKKNVFK